MSSIGSDIASKVGAVTREVRSRQQGGRPARMIVASRTFDTGMERTHLQLEHTAHVDDDLWGQFGPGAVGVGWDLAIHGLDLHLSTGASVDPEQGISWPGTEEGERFVTLSSESWGNASAAAGTPAAAAAEAADRTTAFYTGEGGDAGDG
jgi:hypothetical protein